MDVRNGRLRQVSPPDLYVYDYDWSPDKGTFAAEAAQGSGTNNYWLAELYTIDVRSGKAASIWKPPLQIAGPRFSPDGKTIALIHGIMSDEGSNGGDVWAVPAAGGEARNLTPGMKASATIALLAVAEPDPVHPEGRRRGGCRGRRSAHRKDLLAVDRAPSRCDDFGISDGPYSVVVRDSFTQAAGGLRRPDREVEGRVVGQRAGGDLVGRGPEPALAERRRLHTGLVARLPRTSTRRAAIRWWSWSTAAPPPWPARGWPSRWPATLPSQGYFVFLPNPRGSFGFGEAFTRANVKDFGGGDLRDILSGVDEVLRVAPVDPDRLGITGWSYGGYMTMWAVTQTQRFKAAVAGAGIANWQSYYGQNKIDTWMLPFFGASVYDDPKVYAKSSPMEFILQAKTPTLVLHAERDSEVPLPQGYEFWHALKTLGVPTQLVVYNDEGHNIRQPAHLLDIVKRTVEWFDRYLK